MKDKMRSSTNRVKEASKKAAGKAASNTKQGVSDSASAVAGIAQDSSKKAFDKSVEAAKLVRSGSKRVSDATGSVASAVVETSQGVLASRLSQDLNEYLEGLVKGSKTIYDAAMDAEYKETHIGGGNHRMFDGGHTLDGAWEAVRGASEDDNIAQEAWGFVQGLLRDGTTLKGLPFANWDKATYDNVASSLKTNFNIPKDWFYDLNSYDAAELLGGAIGAVALALNWNRADTEQFARFVGSMGLSSVISANPLLMIVTVVSLAKAFHKAHQAGEYAEFVDGQFKGAIGTGGTLPQSHSLGQPVGLLALRC